MKLSDAQMGARLDRAVKALEDIARGLKKIGDAPVVSTPVEVPTDDTAETTLPAFWMPAFDREINDLAKEGIAVIEDRVIHITMPIESTPQSIREIFLTKEPVAITVGVNYRENS